MGMAASQARLLFITARLHDVELQAQQLLAAKMALATQSDVAWEKYNDALDATTLTVNSLNLENGRTSTMLATFAALTSGDNPLYGATGERYALVRDGALLLSEDDYEKWESFSGTSADDFASYMLGDETDNEDLYDHYYDMYLQIQSCKGKVACVDKEFEYDSEWLTNMVKCGQIQIFTYDAGEKTDELHFDFDSTSPSSDNSLSYTHTTEIDAAAAKKAEAEYEHTLKQIDAKESKIDNELAKLETERNALTTMYDSVKKVIEDNVERTFGIFS